LSRHPEQFESFQQRYCCAGSELWSRGRTDPRLIAEVAGLAVGDISSRPVEDASSYVLVKRVASSDVPPVTTLFDLPAPDTVDLERVAVGASGTAVQRLIGDLGGASTADALALDAGTADELRASHAQLVPAFALEETADTRRHALALFEGRLRTFLTTTQYDAYRDIATKTVTARLMARF
ncbi:MAG TPA: hypothetical protein VKU41_02395, partial [Polyangiaceae bacterium]|nr:hypothetical protein [Polyangiaceae bacterium]